MGRGIRTAGLHSVRCLLIVLLGFALRIGSPDRPDTSDSTGEPPQFSTIQAYLPNASACSALPNQQGWFTVYDAANHPIGFATQTLPRARNIRGYRGPSNITLVADAEGIIVGAKLVSSLDTEDHVRAIRASSTFLPGFHGLEIGQSPGAIDAVSGATLTSYAIIESVALVVSGQKPSLKFSTDLQLSDAQKSFPQCTKLTHSEQVPGWSVCLDSANLPIGNIARTGPLVDTENGYQGPSELLIALDLNDRVIQVSLRQSYDNEPYTDYVRDEDYFWKSLSGKTIEELSSWDYANDFVEGVSGATMTSIANVATLKVWAQEVLRFRAQPSPDPPTNLRRLVSLINDIHWSDKDAMTVVIAVAGFVLGHSRLRGKQAIRLVWQALLIVGLGFWTGNLISIAFVYGWAEQGITWQLAPGLVCLVGLAFLTPPLTKRNLYCNHLCPHGATQQLLRNRLRWKWHPSQKTAMLLAKLPTTLLITAYLCLLTGKSIQLAALEPFNAYLWPVAGTASMLFALGTLAFSAIVPMGYCRYGCPTGTLLEWTRRTAKSGQWAKRDWGLTAFVVFVYLWIAVR